MIIQSYSKGIEFDTFLAEACCNFTSDALTTMTSLLQNAFLIGEVIRQLDADELEIPKISNRSSY